MDSLLTNVNDYCYRNDEESTEFYRDKIPNYLNQMLNQK